MADRELIVDDEFCEEIGNSFVSRGNRAEMIIRYYLNIMQSVRDNALVSGEAAQALEAFIEYAGVMQNMIRNLSALEKRQTENFVRDIDNADKYLF